MRARNVIIFVLFMLVAAGVLLWQFYFHGTLGPLSPATPARPPLEVSVLYASELNSWLRPAADAFNQRKVTVESTGQEVRVTLSPMDGGVAMNAILRGEQKPTVWVPEAMLWVNLLNAKWREGHDTDLLLRSGQYQATPLVLTPMVFVMWEERAQVFTQKLGKVDWDTIQQAVNTPGGWAGLGGPAEWGPFKFGETDPLRSNSGLMALTLATYSYHKKSADLTVKDLDDPAYIEWLTGLERGVQQLADSSANQMRDMVLYGPGAFDTVAIYESLATEQIKNAEGRWGKLHVYYPSVNIWSDHPYAILVSDETSAEMKDAALAFEDYLYSPAVQQTALRFGLRPANPDVPILTNDADNPFNKYKDYGFEAAIGRTSLVPAPPGDVLTALQNLFVRIR
jgi:ABC-type Fe3+ transport system substrate-binding protein